MSLHGSPLLFPCEVALLNLSSKSFSLLIGGMSELEYSVGDFSDDMEEDAGEGKGVLKPPPGATGPICPLLPASLFAAVDDAADVFAFARRREGSNGTFLIRTLHGNLRDTNYIRFLYFLEGTDRYIHYFHD